MPRWLRANMVPDPAWADEDGLVALGGTLDPDLLLSSYSAGVFPWSVRPVPNWWSPDPRAVFPLDLRAPRSVRQSVRRGGWRFTVDQDFAGVMQACAAPAPGRPGSWIDADFIAAYSELFRRGHAHSIEVREQGELIGGLYGVHIGGYFGGESMFHRRADAAKAALFYLIGGLRRGGFLVLDGQVPTPHLLGLGAQAIPRAQYLLLLQAAVAVRAALAPAEQGTGG